MLPYVMTARCATAQRFSALEALAPALDLVVVGLSHQTAPVSIRERVAVRPDEELPLLQHLGRHADQLLLLSTCNRTEVYLSGLRGEPLAAFEGAWGHALAQYLYIHQGLAAAEHLYRVTAGLQSLILGETQIQGQVKRAWQAAQARGLGGALLNKVAQGALATGKRVRAETGLADQLSSVSSAAVSLIGGVFSDLAERTVLVIGAGETAELTLVHLQAAGVRRVVVANRTVAHAQQLAQRFAARGLEVSACGLDQLSAQLSRVEVVIASSQSASYLLGPAEVSAALARRAARGLVLLDISVPRVLDPQLAQLPGVYLYNLDDLTALVQRHLASRQALLPRAEAIVREQLADLWRWHLTRQQLLAQL